MHLHQNAQKTQKKQNRFDKYFYPKVDFFEFFSTFGEIFAIFGGGPGWKKPNPGPIFFGSATIFPDFSSSERFFPGLDGREKFFEF